MGEPSKVNLNPVLYTGINLSLSRVRIAMIFDIVLYFLLSQNTSNDISSDISSSTQSLDLKLQARLFRWTGPYECPITTYASSCAHPSAQHVLWFATPDITLRGSWFIYADHFVQTPNANPVVLQRKTPPPSLSSWASATSDEPHYFTTENPRNTRDSFFWVYTS